MLNIDSLPAENLKKAPASQGTDYITYLIENQSISPNNATVDDKDQLQHSVDPPKTTLSLELP